MASTMTKPVRLQLSRTAGFSLQALSQSINGLPASAVTRPGPHGNPYRIGAPGVPDAKTAVGRFRNLKMAEIIQRPKALEPLRARNLACSCKLCGRHRVSGLPLGEKCAACDPCHADVLLELANR